MHRGFKLAKHHLLICGEVEKFLSSDEQVLLIHAPPGSAKSTYISLLLPVWFLARNPLANVLFATHSADFASRWGRRVRNMIVEDSAFLGISVSPTSAAADHFSLTAGGEYVALGAGGSVAGYRADLGVTDDLFGSREDAWSETVRNNRWSWYLDDFSPRLKPGAKRIGIATRWHEEDVHGRLIEKIEAGNIRGRIIDISAIAGDDDILGREPGEYLWDDDSDYAYGQFLRDRQREVSPMMWSALFQQAPSVSDGDYFKDEWLKFYEKAPARDTLRVYGASDFAVSADKGDYTVHIVVGLDPVGNLYVLDLWRKQASSDVWVESFCDLVADWRPMAWAFETGQIRSGVGPFLERRQRERRAYVAIDTFPTKGDKSIRAQSIRGYAASHGLYLPANAAWVAALCSEMLAFPAGKHDDQCDSLGLVGQLLDKMQPGVAAKTLKLVKTDRWDRLFDNDEAEVSWRVA
ncbi:MAG: phage terminase large subunit [Methylocystis sp.]